MAESTFRPKNLLIPTISLLVLSACGGSGSTLNYADAGTFTGPGDTELDVNKQPTQPVGLFLVDEVEGEEIKLSKIGQQNSPAVAIVDVDDNKRITAADDVRYNQVAFLSTACTLSDCPGGESYMAYFEQERKNAEERLKQLQETLKQQQDANANTAATEQQIRELQSTMAGYAGIEKRFFFKDVDGTFLRSTRYTIDEPLINEKKLLNDAGLTKINGKRDNGTIYTDGGTIDRRFNGIGSLESESRDRIVYFRDPAVAGGWSYQTFLRYYSAPDKNLLDTYRDLLQGYQSIGYPTLTMPEQGWAQYSGISHALYDGNQVTMLNNIRADFGKRSLSYNTSGAAVLHTFEKAGHIIEDRPDLNITGTASWAKGRHDFIGAAIAGNGLRGRLEGRFYGPNAAEVGGVFGMKGVVNGETVQYIGGFGAKR